MWNAWFNPDSFYSYCVMVPIISAILIYHNLRKPNRGSIIKEISFPLCFLIFMFPLPSAWTNDISYHLKFLTAHLSAWMLHATAYGNVIMMPHGNVVVNEACSGIRGILSLLAMSTVFIYWMKTNVLRKMLVLILVIPVALIVNAIRISLLGIVTENWGAQYAKGFIHDVAGLLFFGVSFGTLFGLTRILVDNKLKVEP